MMGQPPGLKILGHVLLLHRLGNNWNPLLYRPGEAHLSRRHAALFGNIDDLVKTVRYRVVENLCESKKGLPYFGILSR